MTAETTPVATPEIVDFEPLIDRLFVAVTDLIRGTMHEGERRTVVASVVAGHCYRIIGVGGAGVRDLDLFLRDMGGRVIDQDRAPDNYPVIGLDRQPASRRAWATSPRSLRS